KNKKEIKHIEQSNTWKLSKGFRIMKGLLLNLLKGEQAVQNQQKIEQLNMQLAQKENELLQIKEQVHALQLKDSKIHTNEVYQYVRNMKNEGELIAYLDQFIAEKQKQQKNYREALTYTARLYMNHDDAYKNVVFEKILSGLSIEEIPEFMIRAGLTEDSIPLRQTSSFRGSLNMRMRQKQLENSLPEWKLDDKRFAYHFAKKLDVEIPTVDERHYTINTIPV